MLNERNCFRFERRDTEPRKQDFNRTSNLLADFRYSRLDALDQARIGLQDITMAGINIC
jgi:hypothetical protein